MVKRDESDNIQSEEALRLLVRRELEQQQSKLSKGSRAWSLLNSSFVLWFLSSVVLAAVSSVFAYQQNMRADHVRKAEIERKLDAEIVGRISQAVVSLRRDLKTIESGKSYPPRDIFNNVVSYLDNFFINDSQNPRDFSLNTEYQRRTFRALLFELSSIVDATEIPALRDTLTAYDTIAVSADENTAANSDEREGAKRQAEAAKAARDLIQVLDEQLRKPQWKTSALLPRSDAADK